METKNLKLNSVQGSFISKMNDYLVNLSFINIKEHTSFSIEGITKNFANKFLVSQDYHYTLDKSNEENANFCIESIFLRLEDNRVDLTLSNKQLLSQDKPYVVCNLGNIPIDLALKNNLLTFGNFVSLNIFESATNKQVYIY